MATISTTSLTQYDLTSPEYLSGCMLSLSNKLVIQNLVAATSEELIALDFDPAKPLEFTQRQAGLRGQLAAYKYLLELSERAETEIKSTGSDQEVSDNSDFNL